MWRKTASTILPLALLIALPVLLRRGDVDDNRNARQLVVISPHNEAIRFEFERAFRQHCREKLGQEVDIDWRTPGGTTEIMHFLRSSTVAAFRQQWEQSGKAWTSEVEAAFMNRRLKQADASPEAWQARQAYLSSGTSVGVDMLFGGGQYDFGIMAAMGVLVPSGFRERHADLLAGDPPVLNQAQGGEIWYDPEDRYYGACFSSFGICFNLDSLADMGYETAVPERALTRWSDLADPRLFRAIGAADPSKSGSINKCFEMIIQQRMAEVVAAAAPQGLAEVAADRRAETLAKAWSEALLLVRLIGANARYFTFSAGKVPVDVAKGDIAAGMCIDFYGRSQAEWEERHIGRRTLVYVTPAGGSSVSVDPIGILRGAPDRELAESFLDFVMSREGQQLWNYRLGEPGGPTRYALRRLPARRDLYTPADLGRMSDPEESPFELASSFIYRGDWTGRYFGLIRELVRVMIIDCHQELQRAWAAVIAAGGPEAVPEAMALLRDLPFEYGDCDQVATALNNPTQRVASTRGWVGFFRDRYRRAEAAARQPSRT